MNDRPTAGELVHAVRVFLEKELLPGLTDARLRFQTLVAANVLSVAGRELAGEEAMLREEWGMLNGVLAGSAHAEPSGVGELRRSVREMNERLCALIRAGEFDDRHSWHDLAMMVRPLVFRKLEVANPRLLAGHSKLRTP
jgi:hypothetical protein